jgi:subtilisin family serine protease
VVAVIDDGVNFSHPELAGRAWTNPGEVPNNNLDDANGYVDDVNGWDFYNRDKTVHDSGVDAHGTHVSGTIAASVDGQGVVEVAPNVKIMALKFLGPEGGYTSDAILAIQYAKAEGAKISNNSWGGGSYDQALYDAINNSGSLFVAAAGNNGSNNDDYRFYPASYDLPNILSVAAVNNQGKLASFSNYGATSVDIAAPGVGILSAVPGNPGDAATLSSVGSSGKALTTGFGADEIGESAKRSSFFEKAFTVVDRGSQQVVLVDDDADDVGFPDVGPSVSSAIEGATGSAPQVIDVPYQSNGPAPSQLSGKTVVWDTGQAYLSDGIYYSESGYVQITSTTLTSTDQATLTQFLNGGGKLIITGMNALYLIENSPLMKSTLNLDVASLVGGGTFSGASGTAFAGESYTFNSPTAYAPYHAKVAPATSAAVLQGNYPVIPPAWESWDGTSMATPHATGAAALVASAEPALLNDPVGLKKRIMKGKPLLAAAGKTVSGDMVDALKALKPPADSTAPTVSTVMPTGGATNVDTTTNVVASFSEAMDAASVTDPANFTLHKEVLKVACTDTVPATLSYDSANATLDPSAPLDESSTYRVTVSGAWDLAGNQLDEDPNTSGDQPKSWSFTTAGPRPGTSSSTPNVWAWGSNDYGQLGDGTTTDRTTPVQVSDLSGVTDVAGGRGHSLALKDDGTVWAWGANFNGQLGTGTNGSTPMQVGGLSSITHVVGGMYHSFAVSTDIPPQPSPSCTISGTANAETISGTSADDVICAGGGNDTVNGLGGNDTLLGEGDNDTLLGGVGNDTLDGGAGTDTASYSASLTAVTASLATNSSTGEGSDSYLGVENLLGSSKADTLTGSDTDNKLTGGGGADTEQGGLGNDQVIGSGGADTLKGEDGDDAVNSKDGKNGNDSLDGGGGTDTKVTDTTEKSIVNFP